MVSSPGLLLDSEGNQKLCKALTASPAGLCPLASSPPLLTPPKPGLTSVLTPALENAQALYHGAHPLHKVSLRASSPALPHRQTDSILPYIADRQHPAHPHSVISPRHLSDGMSVCICYFYVSAYLRRAEGFFGFGFCFSLHSRDGIQNLQRFGRALYH